MSVSVGMLLGAQGGVCFYCSKRLSPEKATRDHLWPKAYGSKLDGNKVIACAKCNTKKGARLPTASECHKARRIYRHLGLELKFT
jgi:5-methylcytosine-specific restriction endonuclease McrA